MLEWAREFELESEAAKMLKGPRLAVLTLG